MPDAVCLWSQRQAVSLGCLLYVTGAFPGASFVPLCYPVSVTMTQSGGRHIRILISSSLQLLYKALGLHVLIYVPNPSQGGTHPHPRIPAQRSSLKLLPSSNATEPGV